LTIGVVGTVVVLVVEPSLDRLRLLHDDILCRITVTRQRIVHKHHTLISNVVSKPRMVGFVALPGTESFGIGRDDGGEVGVGVC
jgi:hypothetical protein